MFTFYMWLPALRSQCGPEVILDFVLQVQSYAHFMCTQCLHLYTYCTVCTRTLCAHGSGHNPGLRAPNKKKKTLDIQY